MRKSTALMASVLLGLWVATVASAASVTPGEVAQHIQALMAQRQANKRFTCGGELICGVALIPGFYQAREYQPAWSDPDGVTAQAGALLAEIGRVEDYGLRPADYHLAQLQSLRQAFATAAEAAESPDPALAADFDLLMTDAFLLLASHLTGGRVDPETIHPEWEAFSYEVDLLDLLHRALQGEPLDALFAALLPHYPGYTGMQKALAVYRAVAASGGWPTIPDGPSLKEGDESDAVGHLRRRLMISGDLTDVQLFNSNWFDPPLTRAVAAFQARHGIAPDGVVGARTRRELNVPVEQRIQQLIINMERWRWIPQDLGSRYILVNIADFMLDIVDQGEVQERMRVVVGRDYRKTPVFSGQMTYLVLNPFWEIPRTLAVEDILPKILEDGGYLAKQGIRVFSGMGEDTVELDPGAVDWTRLGPDYFPYRLRQDPGPHNALGRVKFMFPNHYAVYLHDTPSKRLFESYSRSYSSGCIRVEAPLDLAAFVLAGTPGWDRAAVEAAIAQGQQQVVRLARPVPVHLLYWTAWSDDEGLIHFREDIYERDPPLIAALAEAPRPF